jgi:hypothetical protein
VHTYLAPYRDGWHLRVHRLVSDRVLSSAEGAFCVPWTAPDPPVAADTQVGVCAATVDGLTSLIVDLDVDRVRTAELVVPTAGTNVLHSRTVLPMLRAEHPAGEHRLVVAAYLGAEPPTIDSETLSALRERAAGLDARGWPSPGSRP